MITRRQWTGAKQMNRREFLASTTIAGLTALLDGSDAFAQSKQDTLLVISEGGPNNLDVQGVGANRPGYEVSWNCYDRLVSYGIKTLADGSRSYDQTTIDFAPLTCSRPIAGITPPMRPYTCLASGVSLKSKYVTKIHWHGTYVLDRQHPAVRFSGCMLLCLHALTTLQIADQMRQYLNNTGTISVVNQQNRQAPSHYVSIQKTSGGLLLAPCVRLY